MTESGTPVVPEGVSELDVVGVRRGSFQVSGSGDTSGFGGLVSPIVMPAPTERPYGGWFDELADEIELALADRNLPVSSVIDKVVVDRDEITFFVLAEYIVDFARMLRDEPGLRFEMCLGVNGVHYPEDKGRELHAVYPFLSITHNRRLRVEVTAADANPHIPSIVGIYPSNDWHERETWDFFGIVFDDHPSLTRIEMPDDWAGHPQRKDYPLGGIPVEYKGATIPAPDNRRAYN
ncbi:MAG: NADH-quinone oxidoreductase subunit C [Candidatus Nanopelagicales bacterium]|nr:NADH-quinone oxidoreductase subunit C [Candidatus Nanopelagicales bacterium]MBM02917.1 NADH-quinone oxidoreductase subunit C [Micrococcales bacterium]MBR24598.1 NADH-quinone oxidoreductase subunit C [Rubrivirga sp.]MCH9678812.1 NADH-quinone oxidoreductase subunit C [Actinomycetes bacterium]RZP28686.1 MAG: NADH-quinone oxidoreductase subunit C [Acidimicrobiales bacterium]HCL71116.1 NADH-quinone oxidoreductase subunit C [Actinomycetota bacterium]